eukprot:m.207037 g.207037  ORF g.207037 m.207037 type:complete len:637 (+) comp16913_c1_seq2:399-2309(+)
MASGHLNNPGGLNLLHVYDAAQREFVRLVAGIRNSRKDAIAALIYDQYSFDLIIRIVPECKPKVIEIVAGIDDAEACIQHNSADVVIFVVHPTPSSMRRIASVIKDLRSSDRDFHIINVPRKTAMASLVLEEEKVDEDIRSNREWSVNMIPLDPDLITMHNPSVFRQYVVNKDQTAFKDISQAIMQLQRMYGIIPRIAYKGQAAKEVSDMLKRMAKEDPDPPHIAPEIESLILIDRQIDCVTPLCQQLTYEGLIDEFFGISLGSTMLPAALVPDSTPEQKMRRIILNSSIQIFNDLRGLHWLQVGPLLARRSKMLRQDVAEGRSSYDELSKLKQFASKLGHIKTEQRHLPIHANVAGELKKILTDDEFMQHYHTEHALLGITARDRLFKVRSLFSRGADAETAFIEDCIGRHENLPKVLRLLCIQSLVNGGLRQSTLDFFRREILQTYGFEHVVTLDNLTAAGLLTPYAQEKATFPHLSRSLSLIADVPEDDSQLEDYHFTYMGYAPLSIRVVEELAKPDKSGLRTMDEVLRLMPGPHNEWRQHLPQGLKPRGGDDAQQRLPVSVVCFIGGCTQAEIAALRFLSRRQGREYVVLTTDIITGNTFLHHLSERLTPSRALDAAFGRKPGDSGSSRRPR